MASVYGIASPHLWVYTGEETVCSLRVLVKEGKEAEVKKEVEALLNEVGFVNHTVCVTSEGREEEFVKVGSGGDVSRVLRRFQHHHCHSGEHHHCHSGEHHHCHSGEHSSCDEHSDKHSDEHSGDHEHHHHHNHCSSSDESESDEHHHFIEEKRPHVEFRPSRKEETTTLRLSHDAREKKLLISGGKVD